MDFRDSEIVAADVGGTHVRLALVSQRADSTDLTARGLKKYASEDFPSLGAIFSDYLAGLDSQQHIGAAAIAIAGIASNGVVRGSRLAWDVTDAEIRSVVGGCPVYFVHDFFAIAVGTQHVEHSASTILAAGRVNDGTVAVMGPGTGFGAAIVTRDKDRITVIRTEAGQMGFVPSSELESNLADLAAAEVDRVRIETFLSGSGLALIYRLLKDIRGEAPAAKSPQSIGEDAHTGADPSAERAIDVFFGMMASVARNLALAYYAEGGVLFGGGVIGHLLPMMDRDRFVSIFTSDDTMYEFLQALPLAVLNDEALPMIGAAAAFRDARRPPRG